MALWIVPTPIGNPGDITVRALEVLRKVELIILEEFKESTANLRSFGISGKSYRQLNEHSTREDVNELAQLCKTQEVALVSDCGTPGFCDPGHQLTAECRKQGIAVHALPGASSLTTLLSLSSERINQFLFRGFLSAENEQRAQQWRELRNNLGAIILMDTPYRFEKTIKELCENLPQRKVLIACDLTNPDEQIWEGLAQELPRQQWKTKKPEFLILIYRHS